MSFLPVLRIASTRSKSAAVRLLVLVVLIFAMAPTASAVGPEAVLFSASFDSTTNGFTYIDDTFGTNQPAYASGVRTTSGGFGGSGGLQVTLGGVDANVITGMSGGWSYIFTLGAAESGVTLSLRYRLAQTATYEYDEYSRSR